MRNSICTDCPLHEIAKTVCVWGEGPQTAKMVIIGQNPGWDEDREGRPFIGRTGTFLRKMLSDVGIAENEAYITNAVKCVTPRDGKQVNRKPSPGELKACKHYLFEELAALQPTVIVVLGDTALQALLGRTGITKARKEFHEWNGIPVVAAFHPSYAVRQPQFTEQLRGDLMRAARYIHPTANMPKVEWVWGQAGEDHHDYSSPMWAFDIETNGVDRRDPNLKVFLIGIFDGKTCVVYPPDKIELGLDRMIQAARKHVKIVGHNSISFDAEYLYEIYHKYLLTHDTMILAHLVDENGPLSLEQLACTHLGVKPWKEQVTWKWTEFDESQLEQAAQYNAEDTVYTWHLSNALSKRAKTEGVEKAYEVTRLGSIVFDHVLARNGIAINKPGLLALQDEFTQDSLKHASRFSEIVGYPVNINSSQQVGKALFQTLGLDPVKYTDNKAPSTDEETVRELTLNRAWTEGDTRKEALLSLRGARKSGKLASMLKGYGEKSELVEDHWRLFPEYFSWKTVTLRSTANKGFQLWPHDKRVRGVLTAKPGYVLQAADYGQLQMRIAAQLSGSEQMRAIFNQHLDPHKWFAHKITGKPMADVLEEERYVAKPCNFGLLFGAQPSTLRRQALTDYGLVLGEEQSQTLHDIFHDAYKLEPWYARIAKELKKNGYIQAPLGAIRHLPNIFSGSDNQREEALRQAINAPVQQLEVMIAYIAMWECYVAGLRLVAFLHDAIYVESKAEDAEKEAETIKYIMEQRVPEILATRYGYRLEVPLEVDIKASSMV